MRLTLRAVAHEEVCRATVPLQALQGKYSDPASKAQFGMPLVKDVYRTDISGSRAEISMSQAGRNDRDTILNRWDSSFVAFHFRAECSPISYIIVQAN
jgi:hypothetical protein